MNRPHAMTRYAQFWGALTLVVAAGGGVAAQDTPPVTLDKVTLSGMAAKRALTRADGAGHSVRGSRRRGASGSTAADTIALTKERFD